MTRERPTGNGGRSSVGHSRRAITAVCAILLSVLAGCGTAKKIEPVFPVSQRPTLGPLHVLSSHAHFFADRTGRAILLSGSHTWNTFQDWGASNPPPVFDNAAFLKFLEQHHHNFTRFFTWEQAYGVAWTTEKTWFAPAPYLRSGPGTALDGGPRFDLRRFNPNYFARLRERVSQARDRGIYVSVMLFNGWSVGQKREAINETLRQAGLGNPWAGHPFNRGNNINGVNGDPGGTGEGRSIHTGEVPAITELQKAYVRKVIDTLGDLDNVLWEVCNECDAGSARWQYEMIQFIRDAEAKNFFHHPVGMTPLFPGGKNEEVFASSADWIAPEDTASGPYAEDPPAGGGKVIINDTDHIWGVGGNPGWVWKTLTRGLNPIYMDPYKASMISVFPMYRPEASAPTPQEKEFRREAEIMRRNLGYARGLTERMDLNSAAPHGELAGSGYCLAAPGKSYLVYLPSSGYGFASLWQGIRRGHFTERVTLDLSSQPTEFKVEWYRVASGEAYDAGTVRGGRKKMFSAPFRGSAVLFLAAEMSGASAGRFQP